MSSMGLARHGVGHWDFALGVTELAAEPRGSAS